MMRKFFLILILFSAQAVANPPECPIYPNKKSCLSAVDDTYKNYLDYLKDEFPEEQPIELIQAANDVYFFEKLACQKTCLN